MSLERTAFLLCLEGLTALVLNEDYWIVLEFRPMMSAVQHTRMLGLYAKVILSCAPTHMTQLLLNTIVGSCFLIPVHFFCLACSPISFSISPFPFSSIFPLVTCPLVINHVSQWCGGPPSLFYISVFHVHV